jgi:hypothetical protein
MSSKLSGSPRLGIRKVGRGGKNGEEAAGEERMWGNPLFVQKAGFPRTPSGKNSKLLGWITEYCRYRDIGCIHSSRSRSMLAPRPVDPHPSGQSRVLRGTSPPNPASFRDYF